MACSFISSWFSVVRQHFIRAFDFTRPLCSRITDFALGVIKAIPVVGHVIIGVEWLISSCRERVVRKTKFTSEVASILKVEKTQGRDYLLPLERYLSSVRVSVSEEDLGKVHGKLPENPSANVTSREILNLPMYQEFCDLTKTFGVVRKRVAQAYRGVKQLEIKGLALVGVALLDQEETINFVRLANGVQEQYPNTSIDLYLIRTVEGNEDCIVSKERMAALRSLGLDPKIKIRSIPRPCLSLSSPESLPMGSSSYSLMISYYGKEQPLKKQTEIQGILNLPLEDIRCIAVKNQENASFPDFCFSKSMPWTDEDHLAVYSALSEPYPKHSLVTLGLEASASGLLLDPFRVHAPLSRSHSCPSYLLDIQDEELRRLILAAFLDPYNISNQEFRSVSINFGSSPSGKRWLDFLKRVLQSEDTQHVVVVCNDPQLSATGFTPEAVSELANELKESGYSCLDITSVNAEGIFVRQSLVLNDNPNARSYTVILTDLAAGSGDIRSLQLASDRILVSTALDAADACAAGCKILEYEDPNESWAQEIERFYQEVEQEEKPSGMIVPRDYFRARVCERIASERNFLFILDSAIKQAMWREKVDNLMLIELEVLRVSLILEAYVKNYINIGGTQRAEKSIQLFINCNELDQVIQQVCYPPEEDDSDSEESFLEKFWKE
ncbi:DUF562 domain-containing protein [Chlamydia serpentis]|uniref:DUF562 domain-containing protein n=1 Tax=Chlamydia serpentis TaxID=1967782 RepID=UPI00138FC9E8|nr:DUF562 domain-containing protein [Chlamydia serpentis]